MLLIALVAAAVALMPTREPAQSTAERYTPLFQHQALRDDVRGESRPETVTNGAATLDTTPKVELFTSPIARVRIGKIGVDAAIETKAIDKNGVMESPSGPDTVAWYGFSSKPGLGGNAVLSGHVDYIRKGPAVFWDLKKLIDGDTIDVGLDDGTVISYAVSAVQSYAADEVPMDQVLAQTSTDSLTLITCGGAFTGGKYTHRLVLRATRTAVSKPG